MSTITLFSLQNPKVLLDDNLITFPFRKSEAFFYYIAIEKSITREQAANLLWDTCDESTAKKNLRHTLYTIKKIFGLDVIVSPQKQTLTLNPDIIFQIDYDQLLEENNLDVYRDEFLNSFSVKNAYAFEEWMTLKRTHIRTEYLRRLLEHMSRIPLDHLSEMELYFSRYIKEDSFDERVYQMMMESYQANKLFHKGIKIYQNLSVLLDNELRITPCKEIGQLYHELLNSWSEFTTAETEIPETILVEGRAKEMQFLSQTYYQFLSGTPTSLLLFGENGVGKTYLMDHFLDNINKDSCLVLHTLCFQAEKDFLLQPWNTIMMQLDRYIIEQGIEVPHYFLQTIATLFPTFGSETLRAEIPEDITVSYNYRATRNGILKLFSFLGKDIPIILAFDNIQFMDQLSLDLLSLVIRDCNPNLMILGTCLDILMPDVEHFIHALTKESLLTKLTINRFNKEDVSQFVKMRLGKDALSKEMLDSIYEETRGNAFFLETILDSFSGQGVSNTFSIRAQDILLDRLNELSLDSRQLLDVISLFHDYATLDIIEYIMNRNTIQLLDLIDDLKCHALIDEHIVNGEIQFHFLHNKMQEFVHSQLGPSKRRILHNRVAAFIEQLPLPHGNNWYQRLIYHYTLCGNEVKVLQYKILSLEEYSSIQFELYPILQSSVDSKVHPSTELLSYFKQLESDLYRLYQRFPQTNFSESEARLLLVSGKYCILQGNYKEGVRAINRALTSNTYTKETPLFRLHCLRQLTYYGIQIWDTNIMEETLSESMKLAKQCSQTVEYAIECRLYGLLSAMKGNYVLAREYFLQSIDLLNTSSLNAQSYTLNIAACYNYLGEIERMQQNFKDSLPYYQQAMEICVSHACPENPSFYTNMARALFAMGAKKESEKALLKANRLFDDASTLMGRSVVKEYCAILHAERGNFPIATSLLKEAMESAPCLSSPLELGLLARTQAELLSRYPTVFSSLLSGTVNDYAQQATRYLKDLPGTYELDSLQDFIN